MYSERVDGVSCTACAIFCCHASKSKFITKPFRKWNKKARNLKNEHSTHYRKAMEQAYNFKQAVEHPHTLISAKLILVRPQILSKTASLLSLQPEQCCFVAGSVLL